MVYISDWSKFEQAAVDLYAKAPNRARHTVKFRPKTGQLVLKITDDATCIMYKTFSSIILNRFESLNLRLLSQISNVRSKKPLISESTGAGTPAAVEGDDPMSGGVERTGTPAGGTPAAGGAKSGGKKKKKGKK